MPKTTYADRAAETKAATAAARQTLRELRPAVLDPDDPFAADTSAAGVRQRYLANDPDVTVLDVVLAERAEQLHGEKFDYWTRRVAFLASRELTTDQRLPLAVAPALGDLLGCSVDVVFELPEAFQPGQCPRAFVLPRSDAQLDAEGGQLAGTLRIAYARAVAHRTPQLDAHDLSTGLDDHEVRLRRDAQFRGTEDVGNGVLLDEFELDVRYVMPEVVTFSSGRRAAQRDAGSFAEMVAYRAAASTSAIGERGVETGGLGRSTGTVRELGQHAADKVTVSTIESNGKRLVTVRAELAATPRVHGPGGDVATATSALRWAVGSTVGEAASGLGRCVKAEMEKVVGPVRYRNRAGSSIVAAFVFESTVAEDVAEAA